MYTTGEDEDGKMHGKDGTSSDGQSPGKAFPVDKRKGSGKTNNAQTKNVKSFRDITANASYSTSFAMGWSPLETILPTHVDGKPFSVFSKEEVNGMHARFSHSVVA